MSEDCHDSNNSAPLGPPIVTYPGPYCLFCFCLLNEDEEAVNYCTSCELKMLYKMQKEKA
jgi:hypothetical protein